MALLSCVTINRRAINRSLLYNRYFSRLADELRSEQDHAQVLERERRSLDCQMKDVQTKLDEAEQLAMKGGKKAVQRLEGRIRELETQLDDEQRRLVEGQKNHRRIERRIKELSFQQDEDHKNHERMQELVDRLQNKVPTTKMVNKTTLGQAKVVLQ